MRFFELRSNIRMPASNEEFDLINKINDSILMNEDLNYREQELARKLVSRGLLDRVFVDSKIGYKFKE